MMPQWRLLDVVGTCHAIAEGWLSEGVTFGFRTDQSDFTAATVTGDETWHLLPPVNLYPRHGDTFSFTRDLKT